MGIVSRVLKRLLLRHLSGSPVFYENGEPKFNDSYVVLIEQMFKPGDLFQVSLWSCSYKKNHHGLEPPPGCINFDQKRRFCGIGKLFKIATLLRVDSGVIRGRSDYVWLLLASDSR